jgi:hypothetical protein
MPTTEIIDNQFTPGSVPVAEKVKVYYANDVQAAGGMEAFMKQIGGDQPKTLPALSFSDEEWDGRRCCLWTPDVSFTNSVCYVFWILMFSLT